MRDRGFASMREARELLAELGAPSRLLQHTILVGEAADLVLAALAALGVPVDAHFVRLGVVFHDAGKIAHPRELDEAGNRHEAAGEKRLLERGVDAALAHCCVSHATWADGRSSFEELVVALADKLWKGKREPELEKRVIEAAAARVERPFWDVFVPLDTMFETIAAGGAARLERSFEVPRVES